MTRLPDSPFFLFEDHGGEGRAYAGRLYARPRALLVARRPREVPEVLAAVQEARLAGRHVAGFLAYEAAAAFEARLSFLTKAAGGDGLPLAVFGVFDDVVLLDRDRRDALIPPAARSGALPVRLAPLVDEPSFCAMVAAARAAIADGEIYQVNLTFPIQLSGIDDPFCLYDRLCAAQPVGHAAYVDLGERQILSLSPELFVAGEGRRLTTRPMKGTAARRPDPRRDRAGARDLARDPKNRAENLMIVDLLRNDLSRLAERASVRTERLFAVERYPTLWQMTSTITAETSAPVDLARLFGALFPCGSVTGAPKIRAMEWIARLERRRRGIYTGTLGWAEPLTRDRARLSFNVAIRTLVTDGKGGARLSVGAGIVWDSRPESEYAESLLKARFLEDAAGEPLTLFETMRFTPGAGFHLLERHLARLVYSARVLGFLADPSAIRGALMNWSAREGRGLDGCARVKLSLWRDGRIAVAARPCEPLALPLRLALSAGGRPPQDPWCRHKVSARRVLEEALAEARRRCGAQEVLFVGPGGRLREGSFTNLFLRMPGRRALLTPPLSVGVLPGVLRAELIATGKARVARLTLRDLDRADAVYMGNSLRGLMRAQVIADFCHNTAANS